MNRRALVVGIVAFVAAGPPAAAQQTRLRAEWTDYALQYRDQVDRRITFVCPPGGRISKVYGTDVYTDDSSVCSAAVHAGVIEAEKGGAVTIVIGKGADSYEGSTRNGVTSGKFGTFAGSFTFEREDVPGTVDWSTTAAGVNFAGKTLTLVCPPNGDMRRIWGTDIYTEDSSICSAAVHAGGITSRSGGTVTVEEAGAQESYAASERNGVTSIEWRSWPVSFRVSPSSGEPEATKPAPAPPAPAPPPPSPAPPSTTLTQSHTINTPALTVTGTFIPLVTAHSLSIQQLSIVGIFIPLVPAHNITTAPLRIQGQ